MRSIIPNTFLGSATFLIAEYVDLADDLIDWLDLHQLASIPDQLSHLALAVIGVVAIAQGIPLVGRAAIAFGTATIASHALVSNASRAFFDIIGQGLLKALSTAFALAHAKVEDMRRAD